jgi:sugar lactone lactonase YvrE
MGIAFGPDWDLYIVDNQGWTGLEELQCQGRILRVRLNGDQIEKVTVVAEGMEHPNGIRIRDDYMYVTQSTLNKVITPDGKLMSCVYRFKLDDENIHITNTLEDPNILTTYITHNPKGQYGMDGIVFDRDGYLYVGNFGDATVYRIAFDENGNVIENLPWASNAQELKSTDGMAIDANGNIYIADFNVNAIVKIDTKGNVKRIAQSPDTDGYNGELDQPAEPCVWNGQLVVSCFDLVLDDIMVNTAHEMPATMSLLELEP